MGEEVALAQAYADQVALAITNARLQAHREQAADVPTGHFGLAIMRKRAQAMGAHVQIRSTLAQGT